MAAIICMYKLCTACKFASGIRELHAAPIMLACWLRELNLNLKNRDDICVSSAIHVLVKAYPPIPLSGRPNLVRRYL